MKRVVKTPRRIRSESYHGDLVPLRLRLPTNRGSVHREWNDHVSVGGAVRSAAAVAFGEGINGHGVAARGRAAGGNYRPLIAGAAATAAPGRGSSKNQTSD